MKQTLTQKMSKDLVVRLKEKKIRQVEIHLNFDISEGYVSKVFNGSKSFTLDTIVDISNHFHIPIADILAKHMGNKVDKKFLEYYYEAEKIAFEFDDLIDEKTKKAV